MKEQHRARAGGHRVILQRACGREHLPETVARGPKIVRAKRRQKRALQFETFAIVRGRVAQRVDAQLVPAVAAGARALQACRRLRTDS